MKINLFTPINSLGYGIWGKNLAIELNKHLEVCLIPAYNQLTGIEKNEVEPLKIMIDRLKNIDFNDIGVFLGYGNQMYSFCGRKRIGYTIFETNELPEDWIHQLKQLDRVWVPSNWAKEVLKKFNIESDVIPGGSNINIFKYDASIKAKINANPAIPKLFKFFNLGKWEKRKNQMLLLEAFCEEFKPDEGVALYGMWNNPFLKNGFINELIPLIRNGHKLFTKESPQNSTIFLLNPVQSQFALNQIYNQMDCGVFPYRAEGWGLPLNEALACGLPCIATNYSAPTEFLNNDIAYLLNPGNLISMQETDPVFFKNFPGTWANPDKEELKKLMRYVFEHKDEANNKSQKAIQHMKRFSWWNSANKAISSILNIANS